MKTDLSSSESCNINSMPSSALDIEQISYNEEFRFGGGSQRVESREQAFEGGKKNKKYKNEKTGKKEKNKYKNTPSAMEEEKI